MEGVALTDISRALNVPFEGASDVPIEGVSIDSRTIGPGELFMAIRGERFNGHEFVAGAFQRGAAAAVVSRDWSVRSAGGPVLPVGDTVSALQDLAGWYRSRFDLPVVAVTGTNGKTTTKDMAAAVLSTSMETMKTEGNYNNHIGVPLTLLRLSRRHEVAVVEMGMNHPGEIARLAEIARPTVGVITNVAAAHLETMKSVNAVADAKGELLDALPPDGTAILNADDPRVMGQARRAKARVATFGFSAGAGTRALDVVEEGGVSFSLEGHGRVSLPVPGRHNVVNALGALAVGEVLGVDPVVAVSGLAGFEPSPMRMALSEIGEWTVLNDAYNANPGSLGAALQTLVSLGDGKTRAAVLGDMLELGAESRHAHRQAGLRAAELGIDYLLLLGQEVKALRDGAIEGGMAPDRVTVFEDRTALVQALLRLLEGPAVVLVKGSRGMRMEEVVELLTRRAPAC